MASRIVPTIHARGNARRLDAVLELVAFSVRPRPLTSVLDELPLRIAQVLGADVCSIYLLEGADLVMRGNVGFSSEAVGEIRLALGEGITGLSVEYMRPISLDAAPEFEGYRYFPELGEEKFPIFLAVPIPGAGGPLGALVLQRRKGAAFDGPDIELAAALTAPIAAAVARAELVRSLRGPKHSEHAAGRRVTLSGRSVTHGKAIGHIAPFVRPAMRQRQAFTAAADSNVKPLERAIAHVRKTVQDFLRAPPELSSASQAALESISVMLEDARLTERVLELCKAGMGLSQALTRVGAESVRTASHNGDAFMLERAHELAELCEALALLARGDGPPEVPRSAVLVGDGFSLFDLLVALRARPAAVVLSERAVTGKVRALLALLRVPAITEVSGLFRWATDGELALVDADHGLVQLNPTRAEIALVRLEKKRPSSARRR
jgi:phosphotransferase system enzyme I (PtsP)